MNGDVLNLSIVTASISFAVSETKLFRPLREWMRGRSEFFGDLLSCGYCLGHWVAFALVVICRPRLFEVWWPLDYVLTALVIAWLSAFQWVLMSLLMAKAEK
jgi:hypothetical protein